MKALGVSDRSAGLDQRRKGPRRDPNLGHLAAEVRRRQARGEARGAGGREDVVGAGDVVSEGRRRRPADEQAAGVADARGEVLRTRADQLEVLGGVGVGELEALLERARVDEDAARGAGGSLGLLERCDVGLQAIEQLAAGGCGDDECLGAVLPERAGRGRSV
jgi:hypothetical protein